LPASRYICAFRGRRDGYQVPLALAEAALLDQFVTDAYALPWVRRLARVAPAEWRRKLEFRFQPGIPPERVRCLWATTAVEHARHRLGIAPMRTFRALDRRFSLAAAERAARSRADLFLYSPYAWEAFATRYAHAPRKVLFQFHPHPAAEQRILASDRDRFPRFGEAIDDPAPRELDAWRHADLIFCASAFTRDSLLEAGADERRCRIVPYGIEPSSAPNGAAPDALSAVFVGSGGQRKGLHHLLLAWARAALPASSRLTLVCRTMEQEMRALADTTPRVEVVAGLPRAELDALYARSALFVMPSLVEGFGQVYLEALAQGCPVLGTANTGLPELGGEADGIFRVPPADVEALAGRLEALASSLPGDGRIRAAARACASRFTWPGFRERIRRELAS
jgi:glycosyltransferase involved in cell wall biosynthesis